MKKLILIIAAMACYLAVNAQADLYANHETVAGNNVIYRVYNFPNGYDISNITNTRDKAPLRLLDGSLAPPPFEQYKASFVGGDMRPVRNAILHEVFTQSQIDAFITADETLILRFVVSRSGNIEEIKFGFSKIPAMYSIPPDTWYSLETKIKERFKYNVSPKGQTVQFLAGVYFWSFKYLQGL